MTRPVEGVRFVDHTADVGLDVTAPTRRALFHRAAVGMLALLRGEEEPGPGARIPGPAPGVAQETTLELEAADPAELLARWLKELLFLHGVRGRDYVDARFDRLTATRIEARIRLVPAARAVREIKGVTYHELTVRETEDGWSARVIFDV